MVFFLAALSNWENTLDSNFFASSRFLAVVKPMNFLIVFLRFCLILKFCRCFFLSARVFFIDVLRLGILNSPFLMNMFDNINIRKLACQ